MTDGRLVEPLEPCKSESVLLGEPNVITLRIQADDGICLQFGVKPPGITSAYLVTRESAKPTSGPKVTYHGRWRG